MRRIGYNVRMILTVEQIQARAKKHATRSQLRKHDLSCFRAAQRRGLIDELYPEQGAQPAKLSDSDIIAAARLCATRAEFKKRFNHRYKIAHGNGMIDTLFPPAPLVVKPVKLPRIKAPKVEKVRLNRKITPELVREQAAKYATRHAFDKGDPTCCAYARKHSMMDELFPSPTAYACQTTEGFIAAARKKHGDKFDYSEVNYRRTHEKVKIICRHHGAFWQRPSSHLDGRGCRACWSFDNNAFYVKRAIGHRFNGEDVFKVGVTSLRLGADRLERQSRLSGIVHETVLPSTGVIGSATNIESFALSIGSNPKYSGFDGCSEYRAYSKSELESILDFVKLCASKNP